MNPFRRPTTAKLVEQAMDEVEAEVLRQGRIFSSSELARLMGETLNRLKRMPEPESDQENPDEVSANDNDNSKL
jgi:hypothetical protein